MESTDHESDISKEDSTERLVSSLAEPLKQSLGSQNETVAARKIARLPRVFSVGQNFLTWLTQFIQYANLVQLKNSERQVYLLNLLDHRLSGLWKCYDFQTRYRLWILQ